MKLGQIHQDRAPTGLWPWPRKRCVQMRGFWCYRNQYIYIYILLIYWHIDILILYIYIYIYIYIYTTILHNYDMFNLVSHFQSAPRRNTNPKILISRTGYFQQAPLPNLKFINQIILIVIKIKKSAVGVAGFRIVNFGTKSILVSSNIQNTAAGAAELIQKGCSQILSKLQKIDQKSTKIHKTPSGQEKWRFHEPRKVAPSLALFVPVGATWSSLDAFLTRAGFRRGSQNHDFRNHLGKMMKEGGRETRPDKNIKCWSKLSPKMRGLGRYKWAFCIILVAG